MKHLFRIAAILVIAGLPAAAHAQGLSGGVRAGVNFADLSFDPSPPEGLESKNLTGLVVGFFATVPITRIVAFQPEGLFSMQGTKFSEDGMSVKIKTDYFQVPLLGRFQLGNGSPVSLLVGPALGFKTRAEVDVSGQSDPEDNIDDSIKGFDMLMVAGATFEQGHFVVDGRYTWGITNIVKPEPGSENESARHRVLSLTAGFRF